MSPRAGRGPDAPKVTYIYGPADVQMYQCGVLQHSMRLVSQLARICHLGGIGRTRTCTPGSERRGRQCVYCGPIHTLGARYCTSCLSPRSRGGFSRNWCVNRLHVRCTCILHPSPPSHMAPGSRLGRLASVPKLVLPSQKLTEREHFTIKMAPPLPLKGCTMHPSWVPTKRMVCVGWGHPYHLQQRLYEGVVRIGAFMTGIFETQFLQNGGSLQFWP